MKKIRGTIDLPDPVYDAIKTKIPDPDAWADTVLTNKLKQKIRELEILEDRRRISAIKNASPSVKTQIDTLLGLI
jgi:hypothetical protein